MCAVSEPMPATAVDDVIVILVEGVQIASVRKGLEQRHQRHMMFADQTADSSVTPISEPISTARRRQPVHCDVLAAHFWDRCARQQRPRGLLTAKGAHASAQRVDAVVLRRLLVPPEQRCTPIVSLRCWDFAVLLGLCRSTATVRVR